MIRKWVGDKQQTSRLTRTSSFGYDESTGLLIRESIEPDIAELGTTTRYQYDAFGNKVRTTLSGHGVADRVTLSEYDHQGRFVTRITNALGHAEIRSHDPATGSLTSLTGPNSLTTQWDYDLLGRKIAEYRADGTATYFTRAFVGDSDGQAPDNAVYLVETESTGSAPSTVYFDRLGREVRKVSIGFDGTPIHQDTEYDSRGRVLRSSMPYFVDKPAYWVYNEYDSLDRIKKGTHLFTAGRPLTERDPNGRQDARESPGTGAVLPTSHCPTRPQSPGGVSRERGLSVLSRQPGRMENSAGRQAVPFLLILFQQQTYFLLNGRRLGIPFMRLPNI